MKKLPNFVKWLIIAVVLAAMAAMMVAVNDRASRVEMPMPDNSLGIYRRRLRYFRLSRISSVSVRMVSSKSCSILA